MQSLIIYKDVYLGSNHPLTKVIKEINCIVGKDVSRELIDWSYEQPSSILACARYAKDMVLVGLPLPWDEEFLEQARLYQLEQIKLAFRDDIKVLTKENNMKTFEDLKGKTLTKIDVNRNPDEIRFHTEDELIGELYHSQSCCEAVWIEDINGNLDDLVSSEILLAEETISDDNPSLDAESSTWTFYRLGTVKGYVTIRWVGESNGYYSESVDWRCYNAD